MATITIDRPSSRNAIALETIAELGDAIQEVNRPEVGVVTIRGAGERAFVSGGDLKDMATLRTSEAAQEMARSMRRVLDALATLPVPTVAMLNGHALGGGAEIAVACDVRFAADDVKIAFNQSRLAIMPAWGGCERLIELVGRGRALYLMASGDVLSAADASALGLVDKVFPRATFSEDVAAAAQRMAGLAPKGLRELKSIADTVRPNSHPQLETVAVRAFTELWLAQEHWDAVDELNLRSAAT